MDRPQRRSGRGLSQDHLALTREVAAQLAAALSVDFAAVYELNGSDCELQLRAFAGPLASLLPPEIVVEEWQEAATALQPVRLSSQQRSNSGTGHSQRSIVVPIGGAEHWYGVIAVAVADDRVLDAAEVDFIRSLAGVLAAAWEAQDAWELQDDQSQWLPLRRNRWPGGRPHHR